jgi:2-(1,2-epoxy-1,2-dihydrophenyl)acetyl-CoA isomerase
MSDRDRIELGVASGLAHVRLTRPQAHNAIDRVMSRRLLEVAGELAGRSDLRAVLIDAEGEDFTVGGDLRYLDGAGDRLSAELEVMVGHFHAALLTFHTLRVPVVTAVQGAAAGGGLGLLWCADAVLMADDARLVSGFSRLGLAGDGGSSWAVPRLAGARRAWRFLADAQPLSAADALEWGLVSEVVPAAELELRATELARRLAAGPTRAYGSLRRLIAAAPASSWADQLDSERQVMRELSTSDDARDGIAAFVERRAPSFRGC